MTKTIFLLTFIILSIGSRVFAQDPTPLTSFQIENKDYVKPTIKNLIYCLEITTKEWEMKMKEFDFSDRGFDKGCTYYGSGADLNGVYSIRKCPTPFVSVMWISQGDKKQTVLDDITYELEKYYRNTDEDGFNIYAFKVDGEVGYMFQVLRTNSYEMLFLTRT